MESLEIPAVVELSSAIGLEYLCYHPILSKVVHITYTPFLLIKRPATSDSFTEDTTVLIIPATIKVSPLCMTGLLESEYFPNFFSKLASGLGY